MEAIEFLKEKTKQKNKNAKRVLLFISKLLSAKESLLLSVKICSNIDKDKKNWIEAIRVKTNSCKKFLL